MPEMGRYCKAYVASSLRTYPGWQENLDQLRKETKFEEGKEVEIPRTQLLDDDVLYLQENYVVTDGIFKDRNIIFGNVTDDWKKFCAETLKFEIPDYARDADDKPPANATT